MTRQINRLPFPKRTRAQAQIAKTRTFYHSGNLGDIIYGLYAIRLAGGGNLLIGSEERRTHPCGNPVIREQFDRLLPLLRLQGYLHSVGYRESYPLEAEDMNHFRDLWFEGKTGIGNLAEMQCHLLGVRDKFHSNDSWLAVPSPEDNGRIVVARSFLYWSADFPWKWLVEKFGKEMLFVGWEHEWAYFCSQFGEVEYRPTKDFLDMAQVIRGARTFIGNQSFPMSMALAMGQRVIQETFKHSPDCVFKRPSFQNDPEKIILEFR